MLLPTCLLDSFLFKSKRDTLAFPTMSWTSFKSLKGFLLFELLFLKEQCVTHFVHGDCNNAATEHFWCWSSCGRLCRSASSQDAARRASSSSSCPSSSCHRCCKCMCSELPSPCSSISARREWNSGLKKKERVLIFFCSSLLKVESWLFSKFHNITIQKKDDKIIF